MGAKFVSDLVSRQVKEAIMGMAQSAASFTRFTNDCMEKMLYRHMVTAQTAGNAIVSIQEAARTVERQMTSVRDGNVEVFGISTGFTELDRLTAGLWPGELVVVAGRPGMAKSTFALGVAVHVARDVKLPVLYFSNDMARDELAKRILCAETRLNGDKLRFPARMVGDDWDRLAVEVDRLAGLPLFIDDTGSTDVAAIRSKALRVKKETGGRLGLVIVDNLQQVRGTLNRGNRIRELDEVSRSFKALAGELKVPVFVVSGLNRGPEKRRGSHRPIFEDLRDEGTIALDADLVLLLHRPWLYDQKEDKDLAELIVAKQRNGPTGAVVLRFVAEHVRFENLKA